MINLNSENFIYKVLVFSNFLNETEFSNLSRCAHTKASPKNNNKLSLSSATTGFIITIYEHVH